jgi:UDP-glucose 4-epimerase
METLRVLVTGGVGFIGSHLIRVLVRAGHQVRVLDNLSTGSVENLADVLDAIEFVRGDVRDYGAVEYAVRGVDAVVHLAALIDVSESVEKPDLYFDVNVRGTYNVVKASRSVGTFVFASSSAVYGEPIKVPIPEDHPLMPKSPYAASKVSGEAFVQAFANQYGFRPVILRLFNVYGPKQSRAYAGVIIEFIRRVSRVSHRSFLVMVGRLGTSCM